MSTTTTTSASACPKRRWFQFSLRTMLILTTVVCVWLGYNVRQHHAEQAVIAQVQLLNPQAEAIWMPPLWWQEIFGHKSAGFLDRVQILMLHGEQLSISKLAELPLQKLTSLENLTLFNTEIWDEDADAWRATFNRPLQVDLFEVDLFFNNPISQTAATYTTQPTPANAAMLRRAMLATGRNGIKSFTMPDELNFGCIRFADADEDCLLGLLADSNEEIATLAARTLWRKHCRIYARKVIEYITALQPKNNRAQQVKSNILADLRPESILKEIQTGAIEWGSWLAALRPHSTLTQPLIRAVTDGRATVDTVYALGQSQDPQVVPTLVKVLGDQKLSINNVLVRALVPYASASLETQLIAGLKNGDAWYVCNAAEILGDTGTPRSLPDLNRFGLDPKFASAPINVHNVVTQAIAAIESRARDAAEAKASNDNPNAGQ
jgi:HEAT repeat protein